MSRTTPIDPPPNEPPRRSNDPAELFRDPSLWEAFERNPYLAERSRIVAEMLPPEVDGFLDIGCGDGDLIRALAARCPGIGVDPALTALGRFQGMRICARGESLPLRDACSKLVVCLEVLEHLSDESLRACARELARVADRWLLVATPHREDPMRNALRCPRCGLVFNRSHHLQTFDRDRLLSCFPGFELREERFGGQPVRAYRRPLLWMRHRWARRYFKGPGETRGLCPRCGNLEFPRFRPNPGSTLLDGANRLLSPRRPYWIFLLLEKRSGGSIGGGA